MSELVVRLHKLMRMLTLDVVEDGDLEFASTLVNYAYLHNRNLPDSVKTYVPRFDIEHTGATTAQIAITRTSVGRTVAVEVQETPSRGGVIALKVAKFYIRQFALSAIVGVDGQPNSPALAAKFTFASEGIDRTYGAFLSNINSAMDGQPLAHLRQLARAGELDRGRALALHLMLLSDAAAHRSLAASHFEKSSAAIREATALVERFGITGPEIEEV